ncbi:Clr5 domain-containing protein [Thelonectria olida]|uniref:Clr5 domain-containing protein n=1 Tax=Thelonectria olida TaxID=1576542 RepID=A0A9P8W3A5_9HYPO|nr:Clr5 domain-containing protein [Thelonectria olida]
MSTNTNACQDSEWELVRPHITRLYYDQSKPLREVRRIIHEKYNFDATPRMYKYRLQKWGLEKKFREKEVVQMALLKKQRDATGKQTKFIFRGRPVQWELVERYLYRRPDLQTKIKAGMLSMGDAIPDLVCRSPSPEPVLHVSNTLQYSDELLRLLRGYYESTFRAHTISSRSSADLATTTDIGSSIRCYRKLDQARAMILTKRMGFGFRILNRSLDDLRESMKNQDATLVFYLCDIASAFDQRHQELASTVNRHVCDLLLTTFGDAHPLVLLLRRLVRLSDDDRYHVIATVLEAVVDAFKQINGDNRTVERLKCHYFLLLDSMGLRDTNTRASFPVMDSTSIDAVSVAYLARLADRLSLRGHYEEADLELDMVFDWLQNPECRRETCWADLQLHYYHLRAHGSFLRGQFDEGKIWLKKVVEHSNQYFPDV